VFYFVLPLYSFWNLDDFSWGTTRITADDPKTNTAIAADALDEEQGSLAAVESNKASTTDTSDEEQGSNEFDEPNQVSTTDASR
jgi:uncharacterized protein YdaU (DUF1376 family)